MTEEINLDAEETKRRKPWFTTFIGLVTIGGVVAMPFLAGAPDGEKMPDMVRFLGRFHPVVLHLPIGVFVLIALQEFFAMFSRRSRPKPMFPVFFGAASAVVAVIFGFLLYQGGGYEGSELVEDHLWGGIGFSVLAILTFVAKAWSMSPVASQGLYRLMVFLSVGVMGYASHDGASITHGKDYLWKYAPNEVRELIGLEPRKEKEEIEAKPLEEQIVYADIVAPILEMRCVQCHKEGKSKGRFRMDTYELLVKGGKEGEGIEPGNALDSNIVFRAELPEDDDEHMPPEGKKDIEDHELAIVKWWIDSGADPAKTAGELELTDEIRTAIGKLEFVTATTEDEGAADKAKGDEPSEDFKKAVSELGEQFPGGLTFESQASSNLTFTGVSMRDKLTDEEFAKLQPVISKLVTVDLSSTSVTDASVALLVEAEGLRMIRLSETGISDAAIDTLVQLPNLESVNLYGTAVTDEGVKKLSVLPNLKMLYLWQTDVSDEAIGELQKALPELEVVKGI